MLTSRASYSWPVDERERFLIRYAGSFAPEPIGRAEGAWVETASGKRILDFTSGQICSTLGHNHPRIAAAVRRLHAGPEFAGTFDMRTIRRRYLDLVQERGFRLPDDYLLPHRDKQGRCPRCGGPIATLKAAGRTSYYCPRCQRAPG